MKRLVFLILAFSLEAFPQAGGLIYLPPPSTSTGGTGGGGIVTFSSNVALSGGTSPVYVPFGGGGVASATEADVQTKVEPVAASTNLCVNLSTAPGMGNSLVFTLRDGAADKALTVTISGAAVAACDTTHTFTNAAGDLMDWSIVASGVIGGYAPNVMITQQFGPAASGGPTTNQNIRTVGAFFGSFQSGATALSGSLTACVPTYFAGVIQSVELISDVNGDVTVDVLTVAHGSWTGTASATSITAGSAPALSAQSSYTDSVLAGWTTTFAAGTDVCFAMSGPASIAGVSIAVKIAAN